MKALLLVFTFCLANAALAQDAPFNRSKDLLLLQHDMGNDPDDLNAVAVEACMLQHPDYDDVDFYAVVGTRNLYSGHFGWIDECRALMAQLFGAKGPLWTDAETEAQWAASLDIVKGKVKTVLLNGGRVWVVEAGTSDFTRDWVNMLKNDAQVNNSLLTSHVVVVQHGFSNEKNTDPADLTFVQNNTDYYKIGEGKLDFDRSNTPKYLSTNTDFLPAAAAASNPNTYARDAFQALQTALAPHIPTTGNTTLANGGVDFTDTVEMWWILGMNTTTEGSVANVWDKFIVNDPDSSGGGGTDGEKVFQESEGLVIMEMESTQSPLGNWIKIEEGDTNYVSGATGGVHLEFGGNSQTGGPADSPLVYKFKVNQSGKYHLNMRARKRLAGGDPDWTNDCYVRMEGNFTSGSAHYDVNVLRVDTKLYGGNENNWGWALKLDSADAHRVPAIYQLVAGETYTFIVSGRSQRFNLDRIIFRYSTVDLNDLTGTRTTCVPIR
ncbi:hypothetical protein ACFQY0_02535 [Haloferula chungangensis]|uniref:Uncharacterized protein n=1 Tax=Haloferula chungangensis TaxID=1048331 RepID=A0ABW2L3C1_9BACT